MAQHADELHEELAVVRASADGVAPYEREACEELEYRMGIKAPQRHRKLLHMAT